MADDKIRISWDEVQNPHVDDELRRQAAATSGTSPTQPWTQSPTTPTASTTQPFGSASSAKPILLSIIGGAVLLVVVAVVVTAVRFAGDSAQRDGSAQQPVNHAAIIESVLQQDVAASVGAQSASAVVTRMRSIDLSGCPSDFKSAYVAHIHAWELMAQVESEAAAHRAENEVGAVMVESFIRGFLGDPFGKVNELTAAEDQLQRNAQSAGQQIRDTFHRVEEIAVAHGANLPKTKR